MKGQLLSGLLIVLTLIFSVTWITLSRRTEDLPYKCSNSAEALFVTPQGEVTDPVVKLLGLTGIRIREDPWAAETD